MFFDSWFGLLRTFLIGVLAYVALLVLLRASGKRTLSKMNAFDLIVTVALGSTLATILLSEDVALAEGVTAFAVLISLQYIIAWLSVRSAKVRDLVKSEPALLFYGGDFLWQNMRRERVTQDEVEAAIRQAGIIRLNDVAAVVMETDGTVSVMSGDAPDSAGAGERSSLRTVRGI